LIIAGGVISFWIIGFIIFSAVFAIGGVESVSDDQTAPNARVVINSVSSKSPAEQAGLLMGDIIKTISVKSNAKMTSTIQTVAAVQNFANAHRGEELIVTIQRGSQTLQETLTPRINPPAGEGAIGISLDRVVPVNANWWQAIRAGAQETWNLPIDYFSGLGMIIGRLIHHQALPAGAQVVGPVGIFSIMYNTAQSGAIYYLQLIAKLSVLLAVMNSLPIPALDGGKLLFLAIEAVRRKPVPASVEQPITAVFFFLLMALIILVSIGDIRRLF
jgi:regulator of sigma E protease